MGEHEIVSVCDWCKHPFKPFDTSEPGEVAYGFVLDEEDQANYLVLDGEDLDYRWHLFLDEFPERDVPGKFICIDCLEGGDNWREEEE